MDGQEGLKKLLMMVSGREQFTPLTHIYPSYWLSVVVGGYMCLKQLSMMVYVTEQFLKDVGSLNLLKTIKIFYVLHKCDWVKKYNHFIYYFMLNSYLNC